MRIYQFINICCFIFYPILGQIAVDTIGKEWDSLEKTYEDQFTLTPPFVGTTLAPQHWTFGREVNRYVRLTSDKQSQDGWLWSKKMIGMQHWGIEFGFTVKHEGSLSGDGFAFWVSPQKELSGPVFGNIDFFQGLGIFFDTYANSRVRHSYPYIMAMLGDAKTHYDHDFDGNNVEAGGCHSEFRNKAEPALARVRYVLGELAMDIKVEGNGYWTNCFRFNATLPPSSYFGFTAMTGGVTSVHDITYVNVFSVKPKPSDIYHGQSPVAETVKNPTTAHSAPSKSSWGFFTYLVFFLFLGFIGYVLYVYVKTKEKNSYKRF